MYKVEAYYDRFQKPVCSCHETKEEAQKIAKEVRKRKYYEKSLGRYLKVYTYVSIKKESQ